MAALCDIFKCTSTSHLHKTVNFCSHRACMKNSDSRKAYSEITNGGRCYNNRPTESALSGVVIGLNVKNCYGKVGTNIKAFTKKNWSARVFFSFTIWELYFLLWDNCFLRVQIICARVHLFYFMLWTKSFILYLLFLLWTFICHSNYKTFRSPIRRLYPVHI